MKTFRLRLGILLMALSWFPFAQILIYIAHNNDKLTSDSSANTFRLVVWGIQIVVGLVGVALVGKLAVEEAKKTGWRGTPRRLWELFRHGPEPTDA
jgi:hypothetical protein